MPKGVCLHPIGHNPEGMTLTTDSQLKERRGILKSNLLKTLIETVKLKNFPQYIFLNSNTQSCPGSHSPIFCKLQTCHTQL